MTSPASPGPHAMSRRAQNVGLPAQRLGECACESGRKVGNLVGRHCGDSRPQSGGQSLPVQGVAWPSQRRRSGHARPRRGASAW